MTFEEVLSMKPQKLNEWLYNEFIITIPSDLNSVDNLVIAQEMFSKFGNQYAYLTVLLNEARVTLRSMKRNKEIDKKDVEDMIDKRDAIEEIRKAVDQLKSDLSRMLTVKQQINKELDLDGFSNRMNNQYTKNNTSY